MNNEYFDIRDRIADPPKWWDEFAVPRYCDFVPRQAANIYASEAALVLIECQACGTSFRVCMSGRGTQVADEIRSGELHYGDPPNVQCCASGPSTNCVDIRVIEYWRRGRETNFEW